MKVLCQFLAPNLRSCSVTIKLTSEPSPHPLHSPILFFCLILSTA